MDFIKKLVYTTLLPLFILPIEVGLRIHNQEKAFQKYYQPLGNAWNVGIETDYGQWIYESSLGDSEINKWCNFVAIKTPERKEMFEKIRTEGNKGIAGTLKDYVSSLYQKFPLQSEATEEK